MRMHAVAFIAGFIWTSSSACGAHLSDASFRANEPRPADTTALATVPLDIPHLEMPGTLQVEVLARVPQCETSPMESGDDACTFHGSIGLASERQCEDGCTSWTYRFFAGRLNSVLIETQITDGDYDAFLRDAEATGVALERRFGPTQTYRLGSWGHVLFAEPGQFVPLVGRHWVTDACVDVRWVVGGQRGDVLCAPVLQVDLTPCS